MKKILSNLVFLIFFSGFLKAQVVDSTLSPINLYFQNIIAKYEGLPASLFEAPDIDGNVHYLDTYQDHIVILHFWQVYSDASLSQIPSLNRIEKEYFDKGVAVFGFADNDVEDIQNLLKTKEVNYPVIPNSMEFSAKYYGGEMGVPRVFLIDKYGIVQKVFLGGKPGDFMNLYNRLVPFIEEHLKY